MFMHSTFITAHSVHQSCQLTTISMHTIKKSSCKEFIWYGVWVTVHIHTHQTLSVYCRQMCLLTFTDLPCPFLSPEGTLEENWKDFWCYFLRDVPNPPSDTRPALPFNERLQKQDTLWYIFNCTLGIHPVAVVQYTFTKRQYTKQHNSLIRNSANRAPSLRGKACRLPYNWGKNTEKAQSG